MSWDALQGTTVTHFASPLEGDRFGLSIGRVVVGQDAIESTAAQELVGLLDTATEELLIVRWPTHMVALGAAAAASQRSIIPADVLMYWEVPASRLQPDDVALAERGLRTAVPTGADPATRRALEHVVRDSFRDYGNHYTANPRLDRQLALDGYLDWASRSLAHDPEDVVLLMHEDEPVGVATLTVGNDGDDLEILLAGLTGAVQGQGWYHHLLAGVGDQARARGCGRVIISTQAHNLRVQRAWARAGFRPFGAVTTVHAMRRP
ncbi:acetyltransferase [Intrasporangium oryzae NRRL B-24470]|uniref:Acetyltransferase n=1 Tax=Intrasporangium oryzae NRRL B-24470 TaxID=1386089 RepID=W9G6M4_9MICO|nr:GNAT family N-acetyltransferase [Intrasporangium oryzae]EWT00463.1 acetyltransferase [Intrasporangium oryzae NRRL B-24470]